MNQLWQAYHYIVYCYSLVFFEKSYKIAHRSNTHNVAPFWGVMTADSEFLNQIACFETYNRARDSSKSSIKHMNWVAGIFKSTFKLLTVII